MSDTGKTHVFECIDYALASGSPPRVVPESEGYDIVALEIGTHDASYVIARSLVDGDTATLFNGTLAEWDGEAGAAFKVNVSPQDPVATLSGWLLAMSGFDVAAPVISNQRGKTQTLSFRTVAPLVLVSEKDVIETTSPVLPTQVVQQTASRSVFQMLLTGDAPSPEEVQAIQNAHRAQETATQRIDVLEPIIAELREEISDSGANRLELEADLGRIDTELAELSETVSESGNRVRALLSARNQALSMADEARRRGSAAQELVERFGLLAQHYRADVERLEFVLEGGHFFQQISASHCPTCGQPLDSGVDCHPESADFQQVERAARAEIQKLQPRMQDLEQAIQDAAREATRELDETHRTKARAKQLDSEIAEVGNPTAEAARARVRTITTRRRDLEEQLLGFRELDRYIKALQEASTVASKPVDRYRPEQDVPSLRSFADQVRDLLRAWKFPLQSDVYFSIETDDLVVDGKRRNAFGKGARAVTHAAFTVGLMNYCLAASTPHPGFVAIDSPLTPFRGIKDDEEDPALTEDVHKSVLYSLATSMGGQTVIVENVPAPDAIHGIATIHEFSGPEGIGRRGFYP
jgi:peptidoglycan hydrolase CwlO-like protein